MNKIERQKELNLYMDLFLNSTEDMVIFLDKDGKIAYCSKSFVKNLRIKSSKSLYKRHHTEAFVRFLAPKYVAKIYIKFAEAMKNNEVIILEERVDFGNTGIKRDYQIVFNPMANEEREVVGALVVFHDV